MFPYDVDSVIVTCHLTNNSVLRSSIFYLETMEIDNYFIGTPSLVDVENLWSNQWLQSFVRVNAPTSQPHFYKHIEESRDAFQDKTYSYQVSFFTGIGHK